METNTTKGRAPSDAEDDAGLEADMQDYHRHGGPQGDSHAKHLEGKIGAKVATNDQRLNKARPASSQDKGA